MIDSLVILLFFSIRSVIVVSDVVVLFDWGQLLLTSLLILVTRSLLFGIFFWLVDLFIATLAEASLSSFLYDRINLHLLALLGVEGDFVYIHVLLLRLVFLCLLFVPSIGLAHR